MSNQENTQILNLYEKSNQELTLLLATSESSMVGVYLNGAIPVFNFKVSDLLGGAFQQYRS